MKHFAIIPARHGSKSIINKNLQRIKNKSLIDLTIGAAKGANIFSEILLTTDIPILLEDKIDGVTTIARDESLCGDEAEMIDVVINAMSYLKIRSPSWIWLLQPTSPFRGEFDFKTIARLLKDKDNANSVISVKNVGANHPDRMYTVKSGELKPLRMTNFKNKQDLIQIYIRNGAFYVFRSDLFLKRRTFFLVPSIPYLMDERHSVNIDTDLDLLLARNL